MTGGGAQESGQTRSVLHVEQPLTGGVAHCVADLVRDQVARGFRVTVACPPESAVAAEALQAGAAHVPWAAARNPGRSVPDEVRRLARIVGECDPDLVHLHSSKAGLAGRLAMRGSRPTVFQPHGWSFEAVEGAVRRAALAWERAAVRWTAVILCVSEAERRRGESVGVRAPWRVVANGVDLERFSAASDEERRAARSGLELGADPLVVCVGRLSREKGQDVLLASWPAVLDRIPEARLALVGDGPARVDLERDPPASVLFAGQRTDVPDWLAAADVVAVPSRWEGMALTMLEAMARARSVVTTDVAGADEAVGSGAGAVVPIDDAPALADAIVERLTRPDFARVEGQVGRSRAEQFHDARQSSAAIADLYGELIESRRS